MSNVTLFPCESITIGNNILLGGSVKVYDIDFHWLDCTGRATKFVVTKDIKNGEI